MAREDIKNMVIGPTGKPLTLADLPSANTQRWVIRRKAEVVAAVLGELAKKDKITSKSSCHGSRRSMKMASLACAQHAFKSIGMLNPPDFAPCKMPGVYYRKYYSRQKTAKIRGKPGIAMSS